ncbi:MAG: Bacteriophage replication protein [Abditibacteriota bacterium]|nr:Bacteriophage replication protein [Abditibacteriota bacterium]
MKRDDSAHLDIQTPFTAFPNVLLDQVMPTLKDTEWRLLCVIVRQTIGWRDEAGGRRQRDWISRSQLMRRTGRNSEALSRAVDRLVARRLIVVQDEAGRVLSTARQRQRLGSKLFYALHPDGWKWSDVERGCAKTEQAFEREGDGKANTTKENDKERWDWLEEAKKIFDLRPERVAVMELDDGSVVKQFGELYLRGYRQTLAKKPPRLVLTKADIEKLEKLINERGYDHMAGLLAQFWQVQWNWVKNRDYGLETFLHCVNLLSLGSTSSPRSGLEAH